MRIDAAAIAIDGCSVRIANGSGLMKVALDDQLHLAVQLLDRRLDQIAGDLVVEARRLLDVADHELVEAGGRREGALREVEIGVGILLLLLLGRHLESLLVAPCVGCVTSAGLRVLRHGRHSTVFFVQCKRT